ncbi:hypothetical protein C8Q76DRAFT_759979 [Earliella scabrosa]|nr:hypothetical protein C8Q76DRAFT_759979 [Earliella scabrosa]
MPAFQLVRAQSTLSVIVCLCLVPGAVLAASKVDTDVPCAAWLSELPNVSCGTLQVPLDYHDQSAGTIDLSFVKWNVAQAEKRRGTIFLHSGYPSSDRGCPENMFLMSAKKIEDITGGMFDLVMPRTRRDGFNSTTCGFERCFVDATEKSLFYNRTLSETLERHSSWNAVTGELTSLQTPDDVQPFLQVQEKLITHCIARSKLSDSKYHGAAAISRDIAALADALDGLGSPINLWTESYGSILASYVMKLFPERLGKIVMNDPVDPVAHTEERSHLRWITDVAAANETLALLDQRLADNSQDGFQPSTGNPTVDEEVIQTTTRYMISELLGWYTQNSRKAVKALISRYMNIAGLQNDLLLPIMGLRHMQFPNSLRTITSAAGLGLGAMPTLCGEALNEYDPNDVALQAGVEKLIVDNMYNAASEMATSAFPSLRYLCQLWPIRSVERVSLRPPFAQDLSKHILVLVHEKDAWTYASVPASGARDAWPGATVAGDLRFGDLVWNHRQCAVDMVKDFFQHDKVSADLQPCQDE